MKKMIFVRHGVTGDPDGDKNLLMEKAGIEQVERLAEEVQIFHEGVTYVFFCSGLFRGFQTAHLLRWHLATSPNYDHPVVSLARLGHDNIDNQPGLVDEMRSIATVLGKEVTIVVCHGSTVTELACHAAVLAGNSSVWGTLHPHPKYATGFSVDMATGQVSRVGRVPLV
jgi:broad specificity phosphatase PhoE